MPGLVPSLEPESAPASLVPEVNSDPREARAKPQFRAYVILLVQLALLLVLFRYYRVESPVFILLCSILFGGFAVHYWLPLRFKEWFLVLLSLGGGYLLFDATLPTLLIAAGLAFFGVLASPLPYGWRVAIIAGLFGACLYGRATLGFHIPAEFWSVFGAIFMFRMIVYVYDLKTLPGRPVLKDYLSYFFLLPNYYFLLFPVIDFRTMRLSYFRRDIHDVAQQGIDWIVRGTIHLLLYRFVGEFKGTIPAAGVTSFGTLLWVMLLTYLLYLRVSGQFHIIIGLLHLFGYDLPETNRRYLLASSLTDFWRRINIYWKDFMVKVVYFPVYFKLRKGGEARAQVIATGIVFLVTWLLHSYQAFWLRGSFLLTWPDAIFWGALGLLVMLTIPFEGRRQAPRRESVWGARVQRGLQTAGTFAVITTLWSLWEAPSLGEWFDLVTWWKAGG